MEKSKVVVLYGGLSSEHEVSLRSAASIIRHLDRSRYEVFPIGIDKKGSWHFVDLATINLNSIEELPLPPTAPEVYFSFASGTLLIHGGRVLTEVDVVFPAMHGPLYEDGCVQGFCEMIDTAYVGAGVLSSAMCMDKYIAKLLVKEAGVAVGPYTVAYSVRNVPPDLGFPVFVKPANQGSSVGITKVTRREDLGFAMEYAFQFDQKVLIEKCMVAREIEVAVLEGSVLKASLPGEVVPRGGFYSYEAKYVDSEGADLFAPAELTKKQTEEVQRLAKRVFEILECRGMARVDFFLEGDKFYFNEVNTIPGFTSISMFPRLWELSGLSYKDLLTELVELALQRKRERFLLKKLIT